MPVDAETSTPVGAGRCLVSGATGYVGGRIKAALVDAGWQVDELGRNVPADKGVRFRLGEEIASDSLRGYSALVHCAYDFGALGQARVHAVNVRGSELLLRAARGAGIERLVFISSASAFEGCPSLYGRAKLETEGIVRSLGAWIVRPGLVYGSASGGMFARLVEAVRRAPLIPVPGRGQQFQYLVHEADLAQAVLSCIESTAPPAVIPVTVAHGQRWPLRSILLDIARALDRRIVLVPVPWRVMWAGLKSLEALGMPLGVKSDSLVSLVRQNPRPVLNAEELLGVRCRPFDAVAAIGSPSGGPAVEPARLSS
jgi:nucleoside-diphosphate-sugar epimerase